MQRPHVLSRTVQYNTGQHRTVQSAPYSTLVVAGAKPTRSGKKSTAQHSAAQHRAGQDSALQYTLVCCTCILLHGCVLLYGCYLRSRGRVANTTTSICAPIDPIAFLRRRNKVLYGYHLGGSGRAASFALHSVRLCVVIQHIRVGQGYTQARAYPEYCTVWLSLTG